ncbi:MAG: hypothetical protein JXA79_11435, partial [Deltaproteobacteria bacterium]|nr:hypothetical protein [Deltaproteobacteria bacterium]
KALSLLTTGVPTLSISFEGRRQVFVESKTDAGIYEKIYQTYKDRMDSDRSLSFIEVGHRPESGGEANAGCAQVNRIITALSNSGNESVFGLVDWDGNVTGTSRVKVLCPTIRNGLESAIFDPVLVTSASIRENFKFCRDKRIINNDEVYLGITDWKPDRWQDAVDVVQEMIIGQIPENMEILKINYLNGMTLGIRKDYLHCDDHVLEKAIIDAFGFFSPKNNRAGGLMNYIVETVLGDLPDFLPYDVLQTFKILLNE